MIELQLLKTFCAVAEKKSFTKAGELVHRTQSTISGQISELERFYGTILFDRSQIEITLTQDGELLLNYAKRILKLVDESKERISEAKNIIEGNLIIGASTIPGTYVLPPILGMFKQKYPAVNVSIPVSNSKDVITKVLNRTIEIGVVGEKIKDAKLKYIDLAKDRISLVVNSSHPWTKRENSISLEELITGKFIWREEGSGTRAVIEEALKNKGIVGTYRYTPLQIVMELGSTEAVKEGIKAGLGISFLSEWAIKNDPSLKKVEIKNFDIIRDFYIVFLSAGTKRRIVQAFIDFVTS